MQIVTGNKERLVYHLMLGLLVMVIIAVLAIVVGYCWREIDRQGDSIADEFAVVNYTLDEVEQDGTSIVQEATISTEKTATTQVQGAKVMAQHQQATIIAEQTIPLAERDARDVFQQAEILLARQERSFLLSVSPTTVSFP